MNLLKRLSGNLIWLFWLDMKLVFASLSLIIAMPFSVALADNNSASPELTKQLAQINQLKLQNQQLQQRVQQLQLQVLQLNQNSTMQNQRLQRLEKWVIDRSRPGRILNP